LITAFSSKIETIAENRDVRVPPEFRRVICSRLAHADTVWTEGHIEIGFDPGQKESLEVYDILICWT